MRPATFKTGGIHPPELKTAPADKIIIAPLPREVWILLKQHAGAEARPIVEKGEHVVRGQKIAEAVGKISAPVHSSITGTVKAIAPVANAQGRQQMAINIVASDEDHQRDLEERGSFTSRIPERAKEHERFTPQEIMATIADAGIVGLGGATFPAAVKLAPPPGSNPEVLIINACECEPRLTCDDALMRTHAPEIMEGIDLMRRAAGVKDVLIGIEENKPESIAIMTEAAKAYTDIKVVPLLTKYPQGGEKQLIFALTGKEVPSGGLPISVGAIVQNVATAFAVYCAVAMFIPVIERVVTIDGYGNYLVAIGTRICDIPAERDGQSPSPLSVADIVAGGPMMGQSVVNLEAPVTKGFSGLSIIQPTYRKSDPCIRCGECVRACPMGLEPLVISTYARKGMIDEAAAHGAMDCIECGSCNYSCPSARPILDYIRLSKIQIRKSK